MTIFKPKVKKADVAMFLEQLSFLLSVGYTAYDAAYWVMDGTSTRKKRDRESRSVRVICKEILKDLSEGYSLSDSMLRNPQFFGDFAKQVEAAEASGQVAQVLDQIVANIRESNNLKHKVKSAMIYPCIVLALTFGIAWYLFSFVIPDVLAMLVDVGSGEIPPMTQMVMNITDWLKMYGIPLALCVIAVIVVLVFMARGPLKRSFHKLYTKLPLVSRITEATNVCTWMQSMKYMLSAGSSMSESMKAASDSISNIYMQKQANDAYVLFASTGIAVHEALREFTFLSAMELSTINVGLQSDQIVEVLTRLHTRRKEEAEKAISAFITAMNPAIICILGVIVFVIVMAVYGPLMNVTSIIA